MSETPWWHKALDDLTDQEWEALCDGCGLCCLNKMEDIDTGEVYFSRVACPLLDIEAARCSDYAHRAEKVPDCLNLRDLPRKDFGWLPPSCAYRLRHEGKPLPRWHYLISGDRQTVHRGGRSVCHFALSEEDGHAIDDHLLFRLEDILGSG
ncbi:YcgN family cysteine cluster protein [Suttonella sp. R2A3]|uniref:YcgN family cysteine cluster protein n=1 Tax=Suttonella sp. R2A3 TaxID=2908648 RepID=UPI001F3A64B1|nr:YcgN family cysteine cluster protein [Suttonella sp. R2A3]UJF24778.1 YcgN family cysteine cluster protein [Suttonella sp. R2A3]